MHHVINTAIIPKLKEKNMMLGFFLLLHLSVKDISRNKTAITAFLMHEQ